MFPFPVIVRCQRNSVHEVRFFPVWSYQRLWSIEITTVDSPVLTIGCFCTLLYISTRIRLSDVRFVCVCVHARARARVCVCCGDMTYTLDWAFNISSNFFPLNRGSQAPSWIYDSVDLHGMCKYCLWNCFKSCFKYCLWNCGKHRVEHMTVSICSVRLNIDCETVLGAVFEYCLWNCGKH